MEEPTHITAERIVRELTGAALNNSSNSRVDVHHDGRGTWFSATCCAVMVAVMIVAGFWLSREFNRIDAVFNDLNDKDSVQDAYINKLRTERQKETQS
jgi:hypothetical protein